MPLYTPLWVPYLLSSRIYPHVRGAYPQGVNGGRRPVFAPSSLRTMKTIRDVEAKVREMVRRESLDPQREAEGLSIDGFGPRSVRIGATSSAKLRAIEAP